MNLTHNFLKLRSSAARDGYFRTRFGKMQGQWRDPDRARLP
jgi:hypothetical protein